MSAMSTDNGDGEDFDPDDDSLTNEDYKDFLKEQKKELLLANRRSRLTTMSFHDWFVQTYKRDYKQSDRAISAAYHAGAEDEIENNEYILEHAELKMLHYKKKLIKVADEIQILYSLLETVNKKADMPQNLKKMVRKALREIS